MNTLRRLGVLTDSSRSVVSAVIVDSPVGLFGTVIAGQWDVART